MSSSTETVICPNCRTPNRVGATYCVSCGHPLGSGSLRPCPNCGKPVALSDTFCPNCGFALEAGQFGGERGQQARLNSGTGQLPSNTLLHDHYMIQRRIAKGGMGAVYEAVDLHSAKRLAIKEMSEASLLPDEREQAVADFEREADILKTLDHPNLPKVDELFTIDHRYYMVMEFVGGRTLQAVVDAAGKPLASIRVLGWARQLCAVLSFLHQQHPPIIYRDLKPGNVMLVSNLDGTETVKLIDFGIARFHQPGKTRDTTTFGTAGYSPPEQYGRDQTDARSDIYALGATLHHALTNRDPGLNPFNFGPIRDVNKTVSTELEAAILKAVALDPNERWQTIAEFKRALGLDETARRQPAPLTTLLAPTPPAPQNGRPPAAVPRPASGTLAEPIGERAVVGPPKLHLSSEAVDFGLLRLAAPKQAKEQLVNLQRTINVENTGGGSLLGKVKSDRRWLTTDADTYDTTQGSNSKPLRARLLPEKLPKGRKRIGLPFVYAPLWRGIVYAAQHRDWQWLALVAVVLGLGGLLGGWVALAGLLAIFLLPQVLTLWLAAHLFIFIPAAATLRGKLTFSSNGGQQEVRVNVQTKPTAWQTVRGWLLLIVATGLELTALTLGGWYGLALLGYLPDPAPILRAWLPF